MCVWGCAHAHLEHDSDFSEARRAARGTRRGASDTARIAIGCQHCGARHWPGRRLHPGPVSAVCQLTTRAASCADHWQLPSGWPAHAMPPKTQGPASGGGKQRKALKRQAQAEAERSAKLARLERNKRSAAGPPLDELDQEAGAAGEQRPRKETRGPRVPMPVARDPAVMLSKGMKRRASQIRKRKEAEVRHSRCAWPPPRAHARAVLCGVRETHHGSARRAAQKNRGGYLETLAHHAVEQKTLDLLKSSSRVGMADSVKDRLSMELRRRRAGLAADEESRLVRRSDVADVDSSSGEDEDAGLGVKLNLSWGDLGTAKSASAHVKGQARRLPGATHAPTHPPTSACLCQAP